MPKLEIRSPDGQTELRRLSRRSPIVIGRNPVSDVRVDDATVAPIHCRISWNGTAFEVAAVAENGVDVNGVLVRRKELASGDVLTVGDVQLAFRRSSETVSAHVSGKAAAPVRTDSPVRTERKRPAPEKADDTLNDLNDDDWAALSGEAATADEPPTTRTGASRSPRSESKERPSRSDRRRDDLPDEDPIEEEPVLLDELPPAAVASKTAAVSPVKPAASPAAAPASAQSPDKVRRLRNAKRPGEQDILTSPLVLGLGGLTLLLLLAAGTFWLLMGREAADRVYAAAVADREAGRYAQAIRNYEQFLIDYPADDRSLEARFALGLTRIERYAGGASPDFEKAHVAFDEFVRGHRDLDGFDGQRESLRKLAQQMTSAAAAAATRTGDRRYLDSAEKSRQLYDRYAPSDNSGDEVREQLTAAFAKAADAVRKRELFDATAATMEAAIAKNDFTTAFAARSDLLTRYPDLAGDKRVQSLLAKSLDAEQTLVKHVAPDVATASANSSGEADRNALTPVGHTQARAGEVSDGRLVFAVARDALVGLDAVTGRPRWRTTIGLDTPFFPVEVDAAVPALIAFDAARNELLLLRREDGTPIWRTAVGVAASGPPLVAQGQIDLATSGRRLMRFALDSGTLVATVAFPQSVIGPPVLASEGERLVLFGDQATAYTLDYRSLAVQTVSFTGQASGAVDVAPQALGRLILLCENDRIDSAIVRAFALDAESGVLKSVASERLEGQVREPPVARGNLLFVASSPERITPLSVSDDAGQPPLTRLEGTQIPEAKDVPTFLVPGPDGMLWAAGSALRKLRLVAKGLELLPDSLAPGRHTQPPQESGDSLFVARSLPSALAVYVSQADREAMTGSWRTVLGASLTACLPSDGSVTFVTEAGQTAIASLDDVKNGGFLDVRPLPQWNETQPHALHGTDLGSSRAAVWREGPSPQLWIVAAGGSPSPPRTLSAALQCPPVALDGGLVLPVPGRLEWLADAGGPGPVEAFLLPIGGEGTAAPAWRFLTRIDAEQLAAVDEEGTLRVIRLRREPLPHLAEVASIQLGKPPAQPPVASEGRIAVAVDDKVQVFDPSGLRPVAETSLGTPVTNGPWAIEETVLVQDGSDTLIALEGVSLKERWRGALDSPVAGHPMQAPAGWTIATQAGTIVSLDAGGGEIGSMSLGTPLTGLIRTDDTLIATSLDGSLYPIESTGAVDKPIDSAPAGDSSEAAQ